MIIEEILTVNENKYIKRKSDSNVYIRKVKLGGDEELYIEAVDPYDMKDYRIYEETDIQIEDPKPLLDI